IAMAVGLVPTAIGVPAAPVAVVTGVTVPSSPLTTSAVAPSGVTVTASARCPTGVVAPTSVGLYETGVSWSPFATYITGRLPAAAGLTATGWVSAADGPPRRTVLCPV